VGRRSDGRWLTSSVSRRRCCRGTPRASAQRAPGLAATLLSCLEQEHERAAGAWHAEWVPLTDLLASTGTALVWTRDCLERLVVDPARMRENLEASGGELAATLVAAELVPVLGRGRAHDVVSAAVSRARGERRPLREVLLSLSEVAVAVPPDRLDALLDPGAHVGDAALLVDAALSALAAP
jgi:3-carboxy-cis,cis-muconate cycloisomerase